MRKIQTLLIAGAAAAALALGGAAAVASDKADGTHTMTVQMPGGGVAHIEYTGAVKPRVTFARGPAAFDPLWPAPRVLFDEAFEPFAFWPGGVARDIQRIRTMMREMSAAAALPPDSALSQAGDGTVAPGSYSYSFTSTTTGGKTCARTVQVTASAGGGKPEVVERTSGDCEDAAARKSKASAETTPL